ncbi:MAG: glycoside hydrolase family 55 protein, partial [Carboxylicivirga sp.]|nr:glycoside hydrolase family 55 protein [Carboxylicivirga sp.]
MKNRFKYVLLLLVLSISYTANSQESKLWNEFEAAQKTGKVCELPDFSFAGYHHGEKAIPDVKHKVFNVTDFGAVANDGKSDKDAIRKTVTAAVNNGSGIVFFPKGRFLVNEDNDDRKPIVIKGKNIVFRGSGSGEDGTVLYMKNYLPAKDPKKLWTCPYMF